MVLFPLLEENFLLRPRRMVKERSPLLFSSSWRQLEELRPFSFFLLRDRKRYQLPPPPSPFETLENIDIFSRSGKADKSPKGRDKGKHFFDIRGSSGRDRRSATTTSFPPLDRGEHFPVSANEREGLFPLEEPRSQKSSESSLEEFRRSGTRSALSSSFSFSAESVKFKGSLSSLASRTKRSPPLFCRPLLARRSARPRRVSSPRHELIVSLSTR